MHDTTTRKSPQKWRKCELISGDRLCGQQHGMAINWVDWPRTCADELTLSRRRDVVIVWWAVAGLVVRHWSFVSLITVTSSWSFSDLKFCVLTYWGSAAPLKKDNTTLYKSSSYWAWCPFKTFLFKTFPAPDDWLASHSTNCKAV